MNWSVLDFTRKWDRTWPLAWLPPLSALFPKFSPVVTGVGDSPFHGPGNIPSSPDHISSVRSLVGGQWHCFYFWGGREDAAVSTRVRVFVWTRSHFSRVLSRSGVAGSRGNTSSRRQTVFQSDCRILPSHQCF